MIYIFTSKGADENDSYRRLFVYRVSGEPDRKGEIL